MAEPNTLYVQMFGNFRMKYGEKPLTGEKIRDTYFTSLMQILLHNVSEGVSRDYLEDVLFKERDMENRHQALQTIIYKTKKKLKKMGIPENDSIILKKGLYYWTPQIPVCEDAAEFDRVCEAAKSVKDEEEKLRLYLEACELYKGEFLSTYTGVLWASAEARRYREMFCVCVEGAAKILHQKQDWPRMEGLGRYEDARKLYADTADYYLREQGISPSPRIMKIMERLGNQMKHSYQVIDKIQKNLMEEYQNIQGGYQCSYPVFQGIYQIISRMMERGGQSVYLMLCTLVDSKGNPMKEGERMEEMSERLGEAIRISVRHGDIINQYGHGQYLVLLVNITRENCDVIETRINRNFIIGRQRTGVEYHVNSVVCEPIR